jgi:hypothetical protein
MKHILLNVRECASGAGERQYVQVVELNRQDAENAKINAERFRYSGGD